MSSIMHPLLSYSPHNAAPADAPSAEVVSFPLSPPDRTEIERFVKCLFKHANAGSFVSLRGFDQSDNSKPPIRIEPVSVGDLAVVIDRAVYLAGLVAEARGVFAPPVATFVTADNARGDNIADGVAISVDIDAVNPDTARSTLESILGPATLVISSGGDWFDEAADPDKQYPRKKLHLHWRLAHAARTPDDHARLNDIRKWATQLVGADRTGTPIVHPLRWPGTLHLKGSPRFARIEAETNCEVTLDDAATALQGFADLIGHQLKKRALVRRSKGLQIEDDLPVNLARATQLAQTAEHAVTTEWHEKGFRLGCRMCRLGVSLEVAIDLLETYWVDRGSGYTSRSRFVNDVSDGYKDALSKDQHGLETAHAKFAGVVGEANEDDGSGATTPSCETNSFPENNAASPYALLKLPGVAPVLPEDARRPDSLTAPLILSPASPMKSAYQFMDRHYSEGGYFTLKHQAGSLYRWRGTHYEDADEASLKSEIWRFLDMAQREQKNGDVMKLVSFNPTAAAVANVLAAMEAVANLDRGFVAPCWLTAGELPAPSGIVACANGLLDLATKKLIEHMPSFFTLNCLPFAYDAAAPEPSAWVRFLMTLWPEDADSRNTLQEIFGLLLTAETRFQKAFLLVGPKRSGKSTIARVLTALLGQSNVCGPTLGQLGQQFGAASLIGKRLAIIADARLGGRADGDAVAERILNITGEDSQTIDRKFREAWTGKLDSRLLIISNELPRLTDSSGALASRLVTLVLTESFYGREDQSLIDRLTGELPGILNWAIAGWARLAARGRFNPPQASSDAQQELEDLGSPVSVFVRERCTIGPNAKVRPEELFTAWRQWCYEQGRSAAQSGTQATFGRDLRAAISNFSRKQETVDGVRRWFYRGVGLPSQMPLVAPAG